MAKSFKEIGKKAEQLIEQGKEADQKVQSCQARVASANSRVAAARRQLSAASETDEEGNPIGDVEQARAQLSMAENQLAASQRALSSARGEADRVRQQKNAHVQEIEKHNRVERSNLEKLRQLRSGVFGADSVALTEGMAQRLNDAEDARVALLRSMGMEVTPNYVGVGGKGGADSGWKGGGFATLDTTGQVQSYQGGSSEGLSSGGRGGIATPIGGGLMTSLGGQDENFENPDKNPNDSQIDRGRQNSGGGLFTHGTFQDTDTSDFRIFENYYNQASNTIGNTELTAAKKLQMLTELRTQLISLAQLRSSQIEAEALRQNVNRLRLSDFEKREMGTRYIERIMDVYRDNLIDRDIPDDKELDGFISVLRSHYSSELEKDIAGLPNQLYEDPNYDTICKLGIPFVMGMHSTLAKSTHKDVQRIYGKYANQITVRDTNYLGVAHYTANDGVYMFKEQVVTGDGQMDKPYQTAFHEFGHNIDYLMGDSKPISESWGNNELYRAICEDFESLRAGRTNEQLVEDLRKEMAEKKWSLFQRGSVSDILECMTGIDHPLGAGHGSRIVHETTPDGSVVKRKISYWQNRLPNKEFFAETLDGAAANDESYQMMQQFFPKAVAVVHKIIRGIV